MRLKPIELTEESTLEDIAKEVYQCYIHQQSIQYEFANGNANYASLAGAGHDLDEAIDKLRIKLYKP